MKKYILIILSFSLFIHITEAKPKIGICLGGGAALGYAHIGVLQALEDNGIYPEIISGSSMGAVIGVLYAQGISPKSMLAIIKEEKIYKKNKILDFTFSKHGLCKHKALKHILNKNIPTNSFDSLQKEFYACISNINNATWKMVGKGNLLDSFIIASASIPFVYEPIRIGDTTYVDGGLFNNLPAQVLKGKCDYIIGVDVLPYFKVETTKNKNETLAFSIRGVEHQNSMDGRAKCDYIIEPPVLNYYDELSFKYYMEIYQIGYDITIKYIKEHPEIEILRQSYTISSEASEQKAP